VRLTGYHRKHAPRLFVNFLQPSFRLASKQREGAQVDKRYYPPLTPYQRCCLPMRLKKVKRDFREQYDDSIRWRC